MKLLPPVRMPADIAARLANPALSPGLKDQLTQEWSNQVAFEPGDLVWFSFDRHGWFGRRGRVKSIIAMHGGI